MLNNYLRFGDDRIEVRYVKSHGRFAKQAFNALKNASQELSEFFRLTAALPHVRAVLAPDRAEFDRLVINLLHIDIEIPSHPGRIAQPQKTDIVFLSPPAYKQHSKWEYNPGMFARLAFHELTHVFEEYLRPDLENVPWWCGEGLAVYLSGQWKHDDDLGWRDPILESIEKRTVPDLREIAADRSLVYDFAWTVVKFIADTRGREMLSRIVRESTDSGDAFRILGEGVDTFERKWKNWLVGGENGIKCP